jgi:uncharacterized protein (TIGR03084 family)
MTNSVLEAVLADLEAESLQLEGWVTPLDEAGWATVTTPEGWTVANQIAHLAWTDWASSCAIEDGAEWEALINEAIKSIESSPGFVDVESERWASNVDTAGQLARWRKGRAKLAADLRAVPDGQKLKWFGPPMSPASMATARMMETWGHSQDVAEGLDIEVPRTDRCKHVCYLATRTRGYVYASRFMEAPDIEVRVELTSPSGEKWTWGSDEAAESITGSAWDFALLATRRRHVDDTDVVAHGAAAEEWLPMLQAFAGPPGNDPKRLSERNLDTPPLAATRSPEGAP